MPERVSEFTAQLINGMFIWQQDDSDIGWIQFCAEWAGDECDCVTIHISLDGEYLVEITFIYLFYTFFVQKKYTHFI